VNIQLIGKKESFVEGENVERQKNYEEKFW
jgi:hypothetical protein